jgi:hypothetical protein
MPSRHIVKKMIPEQPSSWPHTERAAPGADLTALPDLLHSEQRAGLLRTHRPVYVDLLPPCNERCPAAPSSCCPLSEPDDAPGSQPFYPPVAFNFHRRDITWVDADLRTPTTDPQVQVLAPVVNREA